MIEKSSQAARSEFVLYSCIFAAIVLAVTARNRSITARKLSKNEQASKLTKDNSPKDSRSAAPHKDVLNSVEMKGRILEK